MKDELVRETCVVRNTAGQKGRHLSVVPGTTAAKFLHYGRIILDASDAALSIDTADHETALIALKGSATVTTGGQTFKLAPYDTLYVPRDSSIQVAPGSEGCDIAEVSAPVTGKYPLQFISFADVKKDPGLCFKAGATPAERTIHILLGKNTAAGRLMAGVTFSAPGNWTSWPPHEHGELAEEAYLYIDMPAPGFGVQLVYSDPNEPELAVVVREGDVVLMPKGYHPNVASPGASIGFLWMMAANRETEDRKFGVVNVQPGFGEKGSGLEAGR